MPVEADVEADVDVGGDVEGGADVELGAGVGGGVGAGAGAGVDAGVDAGGGGVRREATTIGSEATPQAVAASAANAARPPRPRRRARGADTAAGTGARYRTTESHAPRPRPAGRPKELLKTVKQARSGTDEQCVIGHASPPPRSQMQAVNRMRRTILQLVAVGTIAGAAFAGVAGVAPGVVHAVADDDWLGIVNTYRGMSGLAPVTANGTWSSQAEAHSCYMLLNGITHDESPSKPGYTSGGDLAGNNGNVAVSSAVDATARRHIELWMTGPFHAIGILRHNLRSSGFGLCADSDTPTPWHSAGTLDVLRGLDTSPRPADPIVFPGNGATVPLHSFVTESPNPVTMCGWSGPAGLPLIAMMPNDVTSANATIAGPNGPVATCALHKGNVGDPTGRSILDGDNAVIVMPRDPLADGTYTVTLNSNGGDVTWSFTVDRAAPLGAPPPAPPPDPIEAVAATDEARFQPVAPFRYVDSRINLRAVRLAGGSVTPIQITDDPDVLAVSANFVSTDSSNPGYLTTYNCTTKRPEVSTLGYRPGSVVANQAFVPLTSGKMCLYSMSDTDVVIDINGYYRRKSGAGFTPLTPVRLYDSRENGETRLAAGEERVLQVTGVSPGAPSQATAVAINLTAIVPDWYGFVRVYPCGARSSSEISSINFSPWEIRANTVVTPVAADGTICLQSHVGVDVAIDLAGYFSPSGDDFQPLSPVRMFDSRLGHSELNAVTDGQPLGAGQMVRLRIAGRQGVPAGATAASVNVTAVDVGAASYLTAYPCGARPLASNLNITPDQSVTANGAMVKLSSEGDLCVYTQHPVHLVIDINGVWL